ncbi:hypothetical protein [Flavobacterium filum]|uniref:hypothetical protein n=1 Tax=Flavobacterium filum TaxID=370974 RepID=UPI0023F1626D|nr:hypothetical protein [Flavobacterium filum]
MLEGIFFSISSLIILIYFFIALIAFILGLSNKDNDYYKIGLRKLRIPLIVATLLIIYFSINYYYDNKRQENYYGTYFLKAKPTDSFIYTLTVNQDNTFELNTETVLKTKKGKWKLIFIDSYCIEFTDLDNNNRDILEVNEIQNGVKLSDPFDSTITFIKLDKMPTPNSK